MQDETKAYDLAIIGGGINGMGIARDAAGRGLKVFLCDKSDFASGTSSASSKLIHGGLRYLENFEFHLVREALHEREILLRLAPHLVAPLQFYLPIVPSMRPKWMIGIGLWLYKTLAGPSQLPSPRSVKLCQTKATPILRPEFRQAVTYYDGWVDDARLVIVNAMSARALGADLYNYTEFLRAESQPPSPQPGKSPKGGWLVHCRNQNRDFSVHATCIINAGGPWVSDVDQRCHPLTGPTTKIRLVKGSHIVLPQLYPQQHAYILQNKDGRVVFVLPFMGQFSLVGTTDIAVSVTERHHPKISAEEVQYLLDVVHTYFKCHPTSEDVLWSFAGVRPLVDDGRENPSKITRDYTVQTKFSEHQHPVLNILGGKITTYRHLSEKIMQHIKPFFPGLKPAWTHQSLLPGGADFHQQSLLDRLLAPWLEQVPQHPWLPSVIASCIARHGSYSVNILQDCQTITDFGKIFANQLCEKEIIHMVQHEWAQQPDDILYRRTKIGILLSDDEKDLFVSWFKQRTKI